MKALVKAKPERGIWMEDIGWMNWRDFFLKQGVAEAQDLPMDNPISISASVASGERLRMTSSTVLRSSRAFPGRWYSSKRRMRAALKPLTFFLNSLLNSLMKCCTRSGMSPSRSRRGGSWM